MRRLRRHRVGQAMIENRSSVIRQCIEPFVPTKTRGPVNVHGHVVQVSYGKEETGYGLTLGDDLVLHHGYAALGVSTERIRMGNKHAARLIGKSRWARLGIHPNVTELEPGWRGWLTLELTYLVIWTGLLQHWRNLILPPTLHLPAGTGIGVIQFVELAEEAEYQGGFQDQGRRPVDAFERSAR